MCKVSELMGKKEEKMFCWHCFPASFKAANVHRTCEILLFVSQSVLSLMTRGGGFNSLCLLGAFPHSAAAFLIIFKGEDVALAAWRVSSRRGPGAGSRMSREEGAQEETSLTSSLSLFVCLFVWSAKRRAALLTEPWKCSRLKKKILLYDQ